MCVLLQPRPCAWLTSSAVELAAASVYHGDATVRMTAPTTAMKRAARRLVRLRLSPCLKKLNITQASIVVMTTAQNSTPLPTDKLDFFSPLVEKLTWFRTIDWSVWQFFGCWKHQLVDKALKTGLYVRKKINKEQGAGNEEDVKILDAIHRHNSYGVPDHVTQTSWTVKYPLSSSAFYLYPLGTDVLCLYLLNNDICCTFTSNWVFNYTEISINHIKCVILICLVWETTIW